MTFKQLTQEYLDYCRADQQPQWVRQKTGILQRMSQYFQQPLEKITPAVVSGYIQGRTLEVGGRTLNTDISTLRSLFEYAMACGYITRNPMTLIKRVRVSKTDVKVYTPKQIEQMITHARGRNRDYLILLKNTLARVGELNRLKWKDVDLEGGVIWLGKPQSSTKPRRQVPLNRQAQSVLLRLAADQPMDRYVFGYQDKRRMLKRLCSKIGITYKGFHAIRRGMATALMEKGAHLKHISDVLGHANLQNTQYYLKSSNKALLDVVAMLEKIS